MDETYNKYQTLRTKDNFLIQWYTWKNVGLKCHSGEEVVDQVLVLMERPIELNHDGVFGFSMSGLDVQMLVVKSYANETWRHLLGEW